MQLFTRVILLAVTVFSVSAVPRFGEDVGLEQVLFRMVLGEAEGRGLTPAAQTCADIYVNATGKYGDKLANATTACEEAADRTNGANTQVTNATINQIRVQLLTLEQNLQLCRNETDSAVFLNCTVTSFDKNLQLLDTSNSQAYRAKSQFVSNATQVNAEKSNCISSAVSEAKVQSIQAANDFNSCLDKIPTQREVPQQKEQQKKELQLTQVPKEQVSQIPQQKFEDLPLTN
ncbi:uncharacterized protein LOC6546951 [Drosophila erecta]|uniref:Protein TsetseEP domain-containing protein n=1 Tax=Drosophila erecta TaxID=7220 RepID=B3NLM6_DROER|nr:uncharacterized protein LOC6546951 [Drosophila erecta]EDV55001.1 uncharacterized protein Dere_GG21835 [Drosophila erecta]